MVDKLLPGLVGPGLFLIAGAGLQMLLPRPLERGITARLGYAYLLGIAWCSLVLWLASFAFRVPITAVSCIVTALLPATASAVRGILARGALRGWSSEPARSPQRFRWAAGLLAFCVTVTSLALLADTTAQPVSDFDGRMTWGTLARYVASEGSVLPAVLRDAASYLIHPRYPLVMPLAQVVAVTASFQTFDSFAVRPLYVLVFPALLAAVWPALRRAGGGAGAAIAALLVLAAPVTLWFIQVGPRGTFSDFPLGAFLGAGVAALSHPRARREPWRGWVAGLLIGAAAGTKNEGLLLVPALVAGIAWVGPSRLRRGALPRAAACAALAIVLVVAWRSRVPNRNDEGYFENVSPLAIAQGFVERAPLIAARVSNQVLDRESWGPTFWIFPVLVLAGFRGLRSRAARLAGLWVAVEAGLALAAYSVVGRIAIIEVTWNRFLIQLAFPLMVVLAAVAGELVRRSWRRRPAPADAAA